MIPHLLPEFFSTFAAASWRIGCLIVVLALLRLVVRGRVPAQLWFAAWILVAVRLLLPFSIPVAWSPYNLLQAPPVAALGEPVGETPSRGPALVPLPEPASARATQVPGQTATPAPARPGGGSVPAVGRDGVVTRPKTWSQIEVFTVIWLTGVVILLTVRLGAAWTFRRQLRAGRPVGDLRVVALIDREIGALNGGDQLEWWETDAVDTPALYGFWRPRLLLPPGLAAKLTDAELRHVVRHELGHWRRRDLLAQALIHAAVILHWYNPLVWLAARLARVDCELACDEFVLRREVPGGATAYGATLLKVLGAARGRRRPVAVVAMLEGRAQLAHRIRMIASYRTSTMSRVMVGLALVALLTAASLTREARAEPRTPEAKKAAGASAASEPAPSAPAPRSDVSAAAIDQQRQRVDALTAKLQAFKERNRLTSLDQRRDMLNDSLRVANAKLLETETARTEVEIRLNQIKECQAKGGDLKNLPFIANQGSIPGLGVKLRELKMKHTLLAQRYLEAHPTMVSTAAEVAETEKALEQAVEAACRQIEAEFQSAKRSWEAWAERYDRLNREAMDLDHLAAELRSQQGEVEREEQALRSLVAVSSGAPAVGPAITEKAAKSLPDEFSINVVGAVGHQGTVVFSNREKPILLDVIARAGGLTPRANRSGLRLIRLNHDGSRSTVSISERELDNETYEVGEMQAGDILVVPELADSVVQGRVSVLGNVNSPGNFDILSGSKLSLVECLAKAGGATRMANLKQVRLKRVRGDAIESRVVDVNEFLTTGAGDNIILEPGDVIFVPERTL